MSIVTFMDGSGDGIIDDVLILVSLRTTLNIMEMGGRSDPAPGDLLVDEIA